MAPPDSASPPVVVSACLLGQPCRWDGGTLLVPDLGPWLAGAQPLPVCPEVLAGLGVPRPPMHWDGGDARAALAGRARLLDANGRDCTAQLLAGAQEALRQARDAGCRRALLKERSPSCGVRQVHTDAGLVDGCGLFALLLAEAGLALSTEEDLDASR